MKTVVTLLLVVLLSGCGSLKSLEQLEAEAMLSGNWSAVELRERQIARRQRTMLHCPPGQVSFCVSDFAEERCACIDQARFMTMFRY